MLLTHTSSCTLMSASSQRSPKHSKSSLAKLAPSLLNEIVRTRLDHLGSMSLLCLRNTSLSCRIEGHVRSHSKEKETAELQLEDGSLKTYKLNELIQMTQKGKLQWLCTAEVISSALDAMLKYVPETNLMSLIHRA